MNTEELLEKVAASALTDFKIPEEDKKEFRQGIIDMVEILSGQFAIRTLEESLSIMDNYRNAKANSAILPNGKKMADYACYTAERFFALDYVSREPSCIGLFDAMLNEA